MVHYKYPLLLLVLLNLSESDETGKWILEDEREKTCLHIHVDMAHYKYKILLLVLVNLSKSDKEGN